MKKETEKKISVFLLILFLNSMLLVISGSFKINILLDILDPEIVQSAKLSSYVSLITSSLFSSVVIVIISLIAYFSIQIFELRITTINLINGLINSIIVLMVFELIRIILTILVFDEAVVNIGNIENFIEELKNSRWFLYDNIIKFLMILSTGIVFGLNNIYENKNYLNVIILSIIITLGFYISTINLFHSM